jgi:hypothetical protein
MKDPVGAASAANRVLRFGEDGRGSGLASSGFIDGWRESPRPAATDGSGEPSRTNVAPKLHPYRSARGTLHLPGNVKRAVSRGGHGRQTAATVCLDSQADKSSDVATGGRLASGAT